MKDLKKAQELLLKYKTNLKENNNIFTDEMLEYLIEAARLGSDEAMYDIYWNWAFERYNVYNKNAFRYNLAEEEALYFLYESAKTYELAEVKIAENYLKGAWGFKKDEEKGVELLNIAIQKGSLIAKAELGVYLLKKDYIKAKALIEDACFDKQNDSFNCFEDAYQWLFLESFYKKNDIDLAEKYKEDIIKHNHKKLANLIFDLADYYMYGELNEEKAYKTYKEAKDLVNFNGSIEHFVYDSYSKGYINDGYSIKSDYGLSGDLSLKEKAFQFKEYAFNLEDDVTIVFNQWLDSLPYNLWLTINDSFVLNPKNKEEKNIDKSISYLDRIKTIDSDFGYDCFLGITYALYNDLKAKEILLRYINKIDEKAYLDYLNKVLNKLDYHRPNKLIKTNKNEFFYVVDEYDDKNLINTRIAYFLLGMVLQKVEPDEAIKYYLKSEFSNAYTIVGKMYFSGRDIKKDLNEAIKYLEIAKSRHEKVDEELSFSYRYREVKTDEDEIVESLDNDKIVFENYNKKIPDIFISWYHKTQNEKNAVRKYFERKYLVFDSDLDAKGDLDECIKDAIQLSKTFILMINYDSVMWANYVPLEVTQILRRVAKGELAKENINVLIIASPDHPVNDVNKALSIKAQESISKYAKDCCIDESNAYNTFIKELINNESIIQEYKYMGYYFINTLAQSYIVLDMNEPQYCFDKLDVCLNEGIYNYIIHEYKKGLKEKYPRFQYAFSDYMDDESNIPMFINFNSGFIEKKLLKNNKLYMLKEIDYSKNIFIYGRGGSGKSLLLKYIQMNYLNDLSFYLPITEIEEYMENGFKSIEEIIHEKYFKNQIKPEVLNNIFNNRTKTFHFLIDALDEASSINEVIKIIKHFKETHFSNILFIFTTRNSIDKELYLDDFVKDIDTYIIDGFNDLDIDYLIDNISNNINKFNSYEFANDYKKKILKKSMRTLDRMIKENPVLISNYIFLYFKDGKEYKNIYETIEGSKRILFDNLEKSKGLFEKEVVQSLYNKEYSLDRLFSEYSYQKMINKKENNETIIDSLLKDNKLTESFLKLMRRRNIINENGLSHKLFLEFFASCFIYSKLVNINNNLLTYNPNNKQYVDYLFLDDPSWSNTGINVLYHLDEDTKKLVSLTLNKKLKREMLISFKKFVKEVYANNKMPKSTKDRIVPATYYNVEILDKYFKDK